MRAWLARRRRLATAVLLAAAVVSGLSAASPARPRLVPVVVAAHDLAAGRVLSAGDLAVARLPREARPRGAFQQDPALLGRAVAAAVRAGEPITDVRLVGPGLLLGASGLVEAPVRVADGATVALVRPGDRVDILAAPGADTEDASTAYPPTADQPAAGGLAQAQLVAEAAQVLAIPLTPADEASSGGALLVLAVSPTTSRILAAAAASERLSLVIR